MKLHILGSCAGTEPMPGRHHLGLAVETGGRTMFFDAGETSSYTAHLMGLDLLAVREIFITHTHMDHIGGLGNLFWNIRKLTNVEKRALPDGAVDLYIPNLAAWDALLTLLRVTEGDFKCNFEINAREVADGVVCERGGAVVEALHNLHMPRAEGQPWRSFSYRLRAEGKTVVFSGDVKTAADLEPFLIGGCDALFMETGHHHPVAICEYLNAKGYKVGKICYVHHGRDILYHPERSEREIREIYLGDFVICGDGQTIEI